MLKKIAAGVYQTCGGGLSRSGDAMGYLVESATPSLIDCGCEPESGRIIMENLQESSFEPDRIEYLILTHGHVDHIGGIAPIVQRANCKVLCHAGDADAIRAGDPKKTAASWYGVQLPRVTIDIVLEGDGGEMGGLSWVHAPGHTPGSICLLYQSAEGLVLFGQDIHGPFHGDFDSDIALWADSMKRLIDLEADILCEGHFGIFRGRDRVRAFIEEHLEAHGYG
jgi:glyoxylase-like metal-dependent hydrolase (beta-lactamase superfamily II)